MDTIVIADLSKRYGRRLGVEGLSMSVPAGAVYGFLGPNGSGKTTTIRVLVGLLRPNGGHATVFGLDCWHESRRIKIDLGYVPGDLRLYPWMTARNSLKIFGQIRGRDLVRPGLDLAEHFRLDPDVRVRTMSRGMRQKLGLVLALAHRPRLLVLDEPTSALDPPMQHSLFQHLRGLASEGATIFFSSHALNEVEELCDHVAILREGRLVADERLDVLRARAHRSVTVRWKNGADPDHVAPPAEFVVEERRPREWRGTLVGPATALAQWSVDQPLEDLSISAPDLDSLFRRFYLAPGAGS